jgi:polyphosphate glucokinase
MSILVVDVGGTNVKVKLSDREEVRKHPSGPRMTAADMVAAVKELAADWDYDRVTIGYPGPIANGQILLEPHNLGEGWVGFDFEKALAKPVKLINDAAMQALGSYTGGRMLFLGLGTGLGSALILDGSVAAMELGHLPYKKGRSFEFYLGEAGRKKRGNRKWLASVADIVLRLQRALIADYVVLGGGNAKRLPELPHGARLGSNEHAFLGGARLWEATPATAHDGARPALDASDLVGDRGASQKAEG